MKLIQEGISAFEASRHDEAMGFFRRAAVEAFGSPEPWFWMGRVREEQGDKAAAGYCYYMACDMGRHVQSKQALVRLGYHDQRHGGRKASGAALNTGSLYTIFRGVKS